MVEIRKEGPTIFGTGSSKLSMRQDAFGARIVASAIGVPLVDGTDREVIR